MQKQNLLAYRRRASCQRVSLRSVDPVPATRFRAHGGSRAVQPDLLFIGLLRGRWGDIEDDLQCLSDISVFDGQFPCQEDLGAILVRREVGHTEAVAAALNDAMRLGR